MEFPIQVCCLCNKAIGAKDPRVNYAKKVFHGPCFVEHCRRTHEEDKKKRLEK